jgi:uncharacterized protein YbjT (DUF2867 family)
MRVLVPGAYGLIGSACLARLRSEGHELIGLGRSIDQARWRFPYARWITADFAKLTDPAAWQAFLQGIDAVVNCVGVLQNGLGDSIKRVQLDACGPVQGLRACWHQARPNPDARYSGASSKDRKTVAPRIS